MDAAGAGSYVDGTLGNVLRSKKNEAVAEVVAHAVDRYLSVEQTPEKAESGAEGSVIGIGASRLST